MKRLILAAGVAALAITAPAVSQPSDRGGKDRRAEVQKQRSEARAQRTERRQASERRTQRVERARDQRSQRAQRVERRQAVEQRAQRVERNRARDQRAQRLDRRQAVEQRAQRAERRQAVEQRAQRVDRARDQRIQRVEQRAQRVDRARDQRIQRVEQRAQRVDRARDQRVQRVERVAGRNGAQLAPLAERRERQIARIANRDDRRLARLAETRVVRVSDWNDLARGGVWLNGCPPGLARKPVACVPPGQVSNFVGQPLSALGDRVAFQPLPNRLRFAYADTDDYYYRYGSGYVYQVNRSNDLIRALLPLFGLGLTVGQPFPTAYSNYYMPAGLQPFYSNSRCGYSPYQDDYYRYANGYVYEIDCRTGLIEDVDPMLGYGYGYGQMMPVTYSAYNVPYQYRPLYYDTSNSYYRYAPGAIYQVDPTTSLITAVAALLTGGMTVGQQLPMGYSAYNVPYQYRTSYYDTPNDWYRYSNGYVYRVDPATQLVTAIVASALA